MLTLTRRSAVAALLLSAATPLLAQSSQPLAMTILVYEAGPAWKAGRPVVEQDLGPHLGYIADGFSAGAVIAYGTEDSTSVVRGYYILKTSDAKDVEAFVASDPGIRSGVLTRAETHAWQVVLNGFAPQDDGQSYAILRMKPGANWVAGKSLTEQDIGAHFQYMTDNAKTGLVIAAGPDASGQEGWYVLHGEKAAMDALVADDPAVKSGLLKPVLAGWNVIALQATH